MALFRAFPRIGANKNPAIGRGFLEQVTGLEPVISAWKANVFPLHYTCTDEVFWSLRKENLHS